MKMNKVLLILCGMISMVGTAAGRAQIRELEAQRIEEAQVAASSTAANPSSANVVTASSSQTDANTDAESLQQINAAIDTLTEDITTAKKMKATKGSPEAAQKTAAFKKAQGDLTKIKADVAKLLLDSSKAEVKPKIDALDAMMTNSPKTATSTAKTKASGSTKTSGAATTSAKSTPKGSATTSKGSTTPKAKAKAKTTTLG